MKFDVSETSLTALQRRAFLGSVTATAAACGLGYLWGTLPPVADSATSANVSARAFEPHIGDNFHVNGSKDGPLVVQLANAKAQPFDPNRPLELRREPFTLIFRSAETEFGDQIGTISHPQLGTVEVFLSRVDQPQRGMHLQAVFG